MEQNVKQTLDQLRTVSLRYSEATHDILEVVVEKMESTFQVPISYDPRNGSFIGTIEAAGGRLGIIASRSLDSFTTFARVVIPDQEAPIAECAFPIDGRIKESMDYIPDADLKSKIRAWFDDSANEIIARNNGGEPQPIEEAPKEDIPTVEPEIVSEG